MLKAGTAWFSLYSRTSPARRSGVWSGREGSRQLGPPSVPAAIRARERDPRGSGVARCVPDGRLMAKQCPTRRQLEVLRAEMRASSVAAAGHELGISETTVRHRLSGVYRRTGCLNAAQAAYRLGIGEAQQNTPCTSLAQRTRVASQVDDMLTIQCSCCAWGPRTSKLHGIARAKGCAHSGRRGRPEH